MGQAILYVRTRAFPFKANSCFPFYREPS
jgi:hypothetical protein